MEKINVRVEHACKGIEEVYNVENYQEALEMFCDNHGWELAPDVTVAEVGTFYDRNRNTHGGARPGSGRKPGSPKPSRCFRLDDTEYEAVRQFIKNMRKHIAESK